jgi:hypothetical protein
MVWVEMTFRFVFALQVMVLHNSLMEVSDVHSCVCMEGSPSHSLVNPQSLFVYQQCEKRCTTVSRVCNLFNLSLQADQPSKAYFE